MPVLPHLKVQNSDDRDWPGLARHLTEQREAEERSRWPRGWRMKRRTAAADLSEVCW